MVPTFILPSHVTLLLFIVATYLWLFQLSHSFCYEYVVKIPLLLGGIYLSLIVFQAAQEGRRPWNPNKLSHHDNNTSIRQQQLAYRERLLVLKEKEMEKKFIQLQKSLADKLQLCMVQTEKNNLKEDTKSPLLSNSYELEEPKCTEINFLPPKKSTLSKESETNGKERKITKRKWFRRRFFHKNTI
ncbi:hypothetical protein Gasu2_43840 [Galdieria sulphuraria]|uniref:Uncharacterized protein n=1 Tax=Galdieria sulphuraria TaxID=130081 RepID=M2VWY3_GALSU|nr:uncharacterized protein Gasu_47470 [Galdieria sulphuraria]EME27761.1 hypothetical protein Gasu_47470 [Galdieria sulphuraria]GJD10176.1 hypothetical protein Gasu2_43840 [Galdieria sulphuraria]|eukprot:XP_005704281.1 hypothetical protein Gasu_47470 [Galdieria sulphuraria]